MMIRSENLVKIYKVADLEVVALQGLDLNVNEGELMGIIGNSGSGKSTLLNMLGGLDRPSAGQLFVDGENLLRMTDQELVKYKRDKVGFVWQNNARNLIPYLTAQQNVELPTLLKGKADKQRARELLERVGLGAKRKKRLSELSGGEQQRVAIAISLVNSPRLLLADEPTGSVDSETADVIMETFRELNRSLKVTVVIVTHDVHLSKKVDRVVAIRDGRTSSEILRRRVDEVTEQNGADVKSDHDEDQDDDNTEEEETGEDSHVELAVLDRAGRLQIPEEYLKEAGLDDENMVKVEMDNGRIVLLPPKELTRKPNAKERSPDIENEVK